MSAHMTTSEMLADIGASHKPIPHPVHGSSDLRRRRVVAQDGSTIGFMDCFEANAFVAAAHAAA